MDGVFCVGGLIQSGWTRTEGRLVLTWELGREEGRKLEESVIFWGLVHQICRREKGEGFVVGSSEFSLFQ